METTLHISTDQYVSEQILISLNAMRESGDLKNYDLQRLIPQIDEAYRRPVEIVERLAERVCVDVRIPSQRKIATGDVYEFFDGLGRHINTEISFVNACRWLRAMAESKLIEESICNARATPRGRHATRL